MSSNLAAVPVASDLLTPGAACSLLPDGELLLVVSADQAHVALGFIETPSEPLLPGPVELRVGTPDGSWRVAGSATLTSPDTMVVASAAVVAPIEDREFDRLSATVGVEIAPAGPRRSSGSWTQARLVDFSAGGAAVAGVELPVGSTVLLRTSIPGGDGDLETRATVVRSTSTDDGVAVCGLAWEDIGWAERARLSAAVVAGS